MKKTRMLLAAAATALVSTAAAAGASVIYFNGSLGISRLSVEMSQDGKSGWAQAQSLQKNLHYRFVFRVVNNTANPKSFNLNNLRLVDFLKPWPTVPRGDEIVYTDVSFLLKNPNGSSCFSFYPNASYTAGTGSQSYSGSPDSDRSIPRDASTDYYVHFKWQCDPTAILVSVPPKATPQVSMKAKELKVRWMPSGPWANLAPK